MPYQQLTLADLRARLLARWESTPYWEPAEATLYINEALQCWAMLTGRWKTRLTLSTTALTYEVSLPASMVYRMRLAFNGYPLSPTSLTDLDNGQPNWRAETTSNVGVPDRPTLWAPVSLTLIYIWPQDAIGGNALVVDGVSATPTLVDDADFVDLSEADVTLLLGYALHAASLKKGGAWFQATLPLFRDFLTAAGVENDLITTSQAYRKFLGRQADPLKRWKGAGSSVSTLVQATAGGAS